MKTTVQSIALLDYVITVKGLNPRVIHEYVEYDRPGDITRI